MGQYPEHYKKLIDEISTNYGVLNKIHDNDFIFHFLLNNPMLPNDADKVNYYFQDGAQSAQLFISLINKYLAKKENIKVLEFASGYGRVSRHLTKLNNITELCCSDIHPEAMQFIADNLGVKTYPSVDAPEDFNPDEKFDVVFALSFFSHMPASSWGKWLQSLFKCLAEDGLLIFTAHGLSSAELMQIPVKDIKENGFYFRPDSEQGDLDIAKYGTTVSLSDYVLKEIAKLPHGRLLLYEEGFWWKHQDLYIIKHIKDYYPQQIIVGTSRKSGSNSSKVEVIGKDNSILYLLDDKDLFLANNIHEAQWLPDTHTLIMKASGSDPIVLLPEIPFKPENEYGIIIEAESSDPVWTIYYLTDNNKSHDIMHRIQFRPTNRTASDIDLVLLPKGLITQRLRIDPGENSGEIKIKRLEIVEIKNTKYSINNYTNILKKKCNNLTPEEWIKLLALSVNNPVIGDMHFPLFPSDTIQKDMVGTSGVATIAEMGGFYKALVDAISKLSWNFGDSTRVLDFGCGFGRLTRFFLKDVNYGNLYGIDTVPQFLHMCQALFPAACMPTNNFIRTKPLPPTDFESQSFDLISAFSVFSHLSEKAAGLWINEFARLLRPGGLVAITVRQRSYLDYCHSLGNMNDLDQYQEIQANAFGRNDGLYNIYENGEPIWNPSGGGDDLSAEFYGDIVIPEKYIMKNWTKYFIVREMYDDPSKISQAFLLLQKK